MTEELPLDHLVLGSIDVVWSRFRERTAGLTPQEYLWQPVAGCWTVRAAGDRVVADGFRQDPEPAPVTTIAWRMHHLAATCFGTYLTGGLGDWPIPAGEDEWTLDVSEGLAWLDAAWAAFRAGLGTLGSTGLTRALGPDWGPYADDSWAALVLHAQDELSHHGAEIALLRDLYRCR
ncbi:MAG TPA: DinB family protein [Jatrophihabitans sp.]|nr:DinB family protein [Jatrophihabitans sp.]